jgi:hypothetical protein
MVSMYTVDAHFLDAASAAVAVAAEAVGAVELAGYGRRRGAGSTLAGPNLHRRVKKLASRRSKSHKRRKKRSATQRGVPNMATDQISFYDESLKKQIEGSFKTDGKSIHVFSARQQEFPL